MINLGGLLARRAELDPDREGLVFGEIRLTDRQLNREANRVAHALTALGVKKGDRVGLLSMNSPRFCQVFFAAAKLGAVLVTLNWRLAPPAPRTRSRPKGAIITHANLFWATVTVELTLDFRPGDRVLVVMPLYHIGAIDYLMICVHRGCTTVLMRSFDAPRMLETIRRERVDTFLAVASMLQALSEVPGFDVRPHGDDGPRQALLPHRRPRGGRERPRRGAAAGR